MLVQVLLGRWRGAKVAVKILKASVQADAAISADFEEEADMLCRLRHPNILDFYGACLTADTVRVAHCRSMEGWVWRFLTEDVCTDCVCALLDADDGHQSGAKPVYSSLQVNVPHAYLL